jgi:hypothetical protein
MPKRREVMCERPHTAESFSFFSVSRAGSRAQWRRAVFGNARELRASARVGVKVPYCLTDWLPSSGEKRDDAP